MAEGEVMSAREHARIDLALVGLLRPLAEDGAEFDTIAHVLCCFGYTRPALARGLVRLVEQGLVRTWQRKGEKQTRWSYVVPPALRHRFAPKG